MNKVFLEGEIVGEVKRSDGMRDFKVLSIHHSAKGKMIEETNYVKMFEHNVGDLKDGDQIVILDGRVVDSKIKGLKFIEAKEVRKIG